MKFAEHLSTHLTPEWRKQYIQYALLKAMLYEMVESAPAAETSAHSRERYLHRRDEEFFELCMEELKKIDLFFNRKMAEARERHRELTFELERMQTLRPECEGQGFKAGAKKLLFRPSLAKLVAIQRGQDDHDHDVRTMKQLREAFSEYYLSLILLQNYQQLNATGFRKILKKHDKVMQNTVGNDWRANNVETAPFLLNKEIDLLIQLTEQVFTDRLMDGDRQAAMKRLRVLPFSEKQHAWTTYRLGFYTGSFLVLSLVILFTVCFAPPPTEPRWVAVRLFRGFLLLFVNIFLVGINMYGWQRNGVNHVLIFEVDPRRHLTYQQVLEVSSMFLLITALAVVGYLYADVVGFLPKLLFPLLLLAVCLLWLFNPFRCSFRSSRSWLLTHLAKCFTAPLHVVTFPDFWLGDQMNSLVTVFLDMQYFVCFYIKQVDYGNGMSMLLAESTLNGTSSSQLGGSQPWGVYLTGHQLDRCSSNVYGIRPLIALLPALIRFLQCLRRYRDSKQPFPHLFNAGKYSTTFFVVIFGALNTMHKAAYNMSTQRMGSPFFYLWIVANCVSFCYTYAWDVKMDWGLFDRRHQYLREQLVYSRRAYYYLAVLADFFLRITWVLNVSLGDAWLTEADVLLSTTAALECVRRFIWNYFRLENEHLNNCGQFRAVRDISLRPLTKGEVEDLIRMVEQEDGVSHRDDQFKALVSRSKNRHGSKVITAGLRQRFTHFRIGSGESRQPRSGVKTMHAYAGCRGDNCFVDVDDPAASVNPDIRP
ncbi:Xenotropic and polytropic retrovirus receptor 1 [Trichinella papuae]|uniref:Xenotropic and polytropic retrovirus receptor 1 n=1 Tax=Trichinella papuae TaxID=268474 RepID=A0A0V1NAH5_9BILA|nr:Xenotropic and polytropic retrovirus receptor 1 [Trichinella papuae]